MHTLRYLFFIIFLIPIQNAHSMIHQKTMRHSKSNSSLYTLEGHLRSLQEQCTELKIRMYKHEQHHTTLQYEKVLLPIYAQLQEASLYIYDVLTYKDIHPQGLAALNQDQHSIVPRIKKCLMNIQETLDALEKIIN